MLPPLLKEIETLWLALIELDALIDALTLLLTDTDALAEFDALIDALTLLLTDTEAL